MGFVEINVESRIKQFEWRQKADLLFIYIARMWKKRKEPEKIVGT